MPSKRGTAKPERQPTRWVIVQLTSAGEREKNPEAVTKAVQRLLGPLKVFVPAVSEQRQDESQTVYFMEGYVFVEYKPGISYARLQEIPYFNAVICRPAGNGCLYSLLEDKALDLMRAGMVEMRRHPIAVTDRVRVSKGAYKNLHGTVEMILQEGELVLVDVGLSSKPMLIEFPSSWLEPERREAP